MEGRNGGRGGVGEGIWDGWKDEGENGRIGNDPADDHFNPASLFIVSHYGLEPNTWNVNVLWKNMKR